MAVNRIGLRPERRVTTNPLPRWGALDGGWQERREEGGDSPVDLVADESDLFDGLPRRILELPVEVPLAGKDGAGVAASHRYDDVGRFDDVGC